MSAPFIAYAETAVLRYAAFGDVQFTHDLDTRNDSLMPVLRNRRHGVGEDAVDAVLDGHFLVAGLDMNIRRAAFESVKDGGVDQLDDGGNVVVLAGHFVDRQRLVGVFLIDHVEREAFGDFIENALRLLGLFEQVGDLRERRHFDVQLLIDEDGEFVNKVEVSRIGEGNVERAVARLQRHKVVAEHQIHWHGAEKVVVDAHFFKVHELAAVAGCGQSCFIHLLDFRRFKRSTRQRGGGRGGRFSGFWHGV